MDRQPTERMCRQRFGTMNRWLAAAILLVAMAERTPANPPILFRDATSDDLEALVDLVESAYRGERSRSGWTSEADLIGGQRIDSAMMAAALRDRAAQILVAELDDRLVGCCEVRRTDEHDVASFGMFAVDPTRQGRGLGHRILDAAEQVVGARWSVGRVRLTVVEQRPELIAWYERRGYVRTGATEPFPYGDPRFGVPRRDDLVFAVLEKRLGAAP